MAMHKLERLLRPKSIAVFGGAQAAAVVAQSIKMGFAGEIWPVHPTKDVVAGRNAYRSVADLPDAPDAAFVGVNRHLTIEVIKALAERCAGGAVCFAAGFLETEAYDEDGERLQAEHPPRWCLMPGPSATPVALSQRQRVLLQSLLQRQTASQRLARRVAVEIRPHHAETSL